MRFGDVPIGTLLTLHSDEAQAETIIDNGPYAPVSILERIKTKTIRDLSQKLSRLVIRVCLYDHERTGADPKNCPQRPYNVVCGHCLSFPEKSNGAAQILWDAMVLAKLMGVLPAEMHQWFRSLRNGHAIIEIPAISAIFREDYSAEARYRELNRPSNSSFFIKKYLEEVARKFRQRSHRCSLQLLQEEKGQELLHIRDQLLEVLSPLLDEEVPDCAILAA